MPGLICDPCLSKNYSKVNGLGTYTVIRYVMEKSLQTVFVGTCRYLTTSLADDFGHLQTQA